MLCCWLRIFIKAVKKSFFFFAFYEPDINPRVYPMQPAHRHDYYLTLDVYTKTLTFFPHSLTRQQVARFTLAMIWCTGAPTPRKSTTTKRCTVLINTTKAGIFARRPCMLLPLHIGDQRMHLHCTNICRPGWMTVVAIRPQSEINSVLKPPF